MILVIGGNFQGKKEYVKEHFSIAEADMADGAVCAAEDIFTCRCINHFHEFVRRQLNEKADMTMLAALLHEKNPAVIIISNELGYGVVPMDVFDREYRELTGRICTQLAKKSRQVHRIICGIGTVIKDA